MPRGNLYTNNFDSGYKTDTAKNYYGNAKDLRIEADRGGTWHTKDDGYKGKKLDIDSLFKIGASSSYFIEDEEETK